MENDANQQPEKPQQPAKSMPQKADKVLKGDRPKRSRNRQRQRRDNPQNHNRPKSKPNRPRKPKPKTALDIVRTSFFACGRCSFFFSAMRAKLSLATVTAMAELSDHGWLEVGWSSTLRELVERSYGCEIYDDTRHYADSCIECGRMFIVSAGEDGQLAHFEIQAQRQAAHLPENRVRKEPQPLTEAKADIEQATDSTSAAAPPASMPEAPAAAPPQTE